MEERTSNTGSSQDLPSRYRQLEQQLSSLYNKYVFVFEGEYKIYNQDIQIFSFCNRGQDPSRGRQKMMLTFNGNPGDVLWNLQSTDKDAITQLMRIHNRTSKQTYSPGLFRGRSFFGDTNATTMNYGPKKFRPGSYMPKPHETSIGQEKKEPQFQEKKYIRETAPKPQTSVPKTPAKPDFNKLKELALKKGWIKKS